MQDTTVTPANADKWQTVFGTITARRDYPDGAHDVQYRHWDQILVDMAMLGDDIVICAGAETEVMAPEAAQAAVENGATLGICAWREE